jgi:hypothetical protein
MQGHSGFPDVVLSRHGVTLFLELKSESGRISPDQVAWLDAINEAPTVDGFCGSAHRARVVYPRDLDEVLAMLE